MDEQERTQLERARTLIKDKRYDDARTILEAMPFNEKANEWLTKLDQVAPAAEDDFTAGMNISPHNDTELRPWNPTWIFGPRLMFLLGMVLGLPIATFFALNWKRLGRPQWAAGTFLGSVLLTLGALAGLVLAFTGPFQSLIPGLVAIVCIVGSGVYVMALSDIQRPAYQKWRHGDIQAMLNHQYSIGRTVLLSAGLLAAIFLLGGVVVYFASIENEFENEYIQFRYPLNWEKLPPDWATYCQEDPEAGCFLTLSITAPVAEEAHSLIFAARATDDPQAAIDRASGNVISAESLTILGVEDTTIAGRPARMVDFTGLGITGEGTPYFQTVYYMQSATHIITINVWTQDEDSYRRRRPSIDDVARSIQVK